MGGALGDALGALRRPEYTGRNRCVPCTVLNVVLALGLAAGVGTALAGDPTAATAAAVAVAGVSAAAIGLRGYLVPGTPWLTRTFFPDRVLRLFEKGPAARPPSTDTAVDPEALLVEAGALEECEAGDDLCLDDAFREAWYRRIERRRGDDHEASTADLAWLLGVDRSVLRLDEVAGSFYAFGDGVAVEEWAADREEMIGFWESESAFLADMSAGRVLAERLGGWAALDVESRSQLLSGLRLFIDRCPSCDAPVRFGEETVQSCCRSREVIAVTCTECGDRLFEADPPAAA